MILYVLIFIFWIRNWNTKHSAPNDSRHALPSSLL